MGETLDSCMFCTEAGGDEALPLAAGSAAVAASGLVRLRHGDLGTGKSVLPL